MYTVLPYSDFVGGGKDTKPGVSAAQMRELNKALSGMMKVSSRPLSKSSSINNNSRTVSRNSSMRVSNQPSLERRQSGRLIQSKKDADINELMKGINALGSKKEETPQKTVQEKQPPKSFVSYTDNKSIKSALHTALQLEPVFIDTLIEGATISDISIFLTEDNINQINGSIFKNKDIINFLVDIVIFDKLWKDGLSKGTYVPYEEGLCRNLMQTFDKRVKLLKKGKYPRFIMEQFRTSLQSAVININPITDKRYGMLDFISYVYKENPHTNILDVYKSSGVMKYDEEFPPLIPNYVMHKNVLLLLDKLMEKQTQWLKDGGDKMME